MHIASLHVAGLCTLQADAAGAVDSAVHIASLHVAGLCTLQGCALCTSAGCALFYASRLCEMCTNLAWQWRVFMPPNSEGSSQVHLSIVSLQYFASWPLAKVTMP